MSYSKTSYYHDTVSEEKQSITIDEMIQRLQTLKEKYGGNTQVRVDDRIHYEDSPRDIENVRPARQYESSKEVMILIS